MHMFIIQASSQACVIDSAFTRQSQIDSFLILNPDCKHVIGRLILDGRVKPGNITNVDAFANLETVSGDVGFFDPSLNDISGFDNLRKAHSVTVTNLGSELSGFNNLEEATAITITGKNLKGFNGFNKIKKVRRWVKLLSDSVSYIRGFNALEETRFLHIERMDLIEEISGFNNLEIVSGNVLVGLMPLLKSVNGFNKLRTIEGYLRIRDCPSLIVQGTFPNLEIIDEELFLQELHSMQNLSHLSALRKVGGISIFDNNTLENLLGLGSLDVHGFLSIDNNFISSLEGIEEINFTNIDYITIRNNENLSFCHEESNCEYLSEKSNEIYIENNLPNCNSITEVMMNCSLISTQTDSDGDGFTPEYDCNDNNPMIYPGNTEIPYNGFDDDCEPLTLDDDLDEDGFRLVDDCDDSNDQTYPGAIEQCDNLDNDCDNIVDEDIQIYTFYYDRDRDGYGSDANEPPIDSCANPKTNNRKYVLNNLDCDDTDNNIVFGDSPEIPYNGIDDDCDESTPDDDLDGDGFNVLRGTLFDCDDTNPLINPDATELCNGLDDNCDLITDETSIFYIDRDADGFGDINETFESCDQPTGYVRNYEDCDDTNPDVNDPSIDTDGDGINDCVDHDPLVKVFDVTKGEILVYPNPVTNMLWIESAFELDRFAVINTLGQVTVDMHIQQKNLNYDVSALEDGLYVLMLMVDETVYRTTFIKH